MAVAIGPALSALVAAGNTFGSYGSASAHRLSCGTSSLRDISSFKAYVLSNYWSHWSLKE